MNKYLLPLLFIAFSITGFANPISPSHSATLFEHLYEVNKEWANFYAPEDLALIYHFENDQQRIQLHLQLVESHLRKHIPAHFTKKQIAKRNQTLDFLTQYHEQAIFPINRHHAVRQPYFIDHKGTACAVGHLVIETGFEALAKQIAKAHNYAYIDELKNHYPELLAWADAFGFTVEELAWIQPGYPAMPQNWNRVGNNQGADGVISLMKADQNKMLYIAGDFTEVDGFAAQNIVAYDGTNWHRLGNGIDGTIHDMVIDVSGRVFVVGDFMVNGRADLVNVAYWDQDQWRGFNTSNMTGTIYTAHLVNNILYVGGDFALPTASGALRNLAAIDLESSSAQLDNYNGDFSVNDIVYDIISSGSILYISGSFTRTATDTDNELIQKLETNYIATWGYDATIEDANWLEAFDPEIDADLAINAMALHQGKLYISSHAEGYEGEKALGIFNVDAEWEYIYCGKIDPMQPSVVNGFVNHNGILLTYGNISYFGMYGMTQLSGLAVVENSVNNSDGAYFDNIVFAAESFQGEVYFAGPFTSVEGQEFPGLVSSPFDGFTNTEEVFAKSPVDVFAASDRINILYEQTEKSYQVNIYSLDGKFITQRSLEPGSASIDIPTQGWTPGIYLYQIISESGDMYSNKLSVVR